MKIIFKLALVAFLNIYSLPAFAIDIAPATTEDVQKFDMTLREEAEKEAKDRVKDVKVRKETFAQRTAAAAQRRNEERQELKKHQREEKREDKKKFALEREIKREENRGERQDRLQDRRGGDNRH